MTAAALCCLIAACLAPPDNLLVNGGFEQPSADGRPSGWGLANGHLAALVVEDGPRTGRHVGRLDGDGEAHAWRQVVAEPGTRSLLAVGWFRARGIKVDKSDPREQYLRFYCHILYRGRPYAETTHQWKDLPAGDFNWTRFAVPLTPRTDQPVECVWITVAGRFTA
ncbi:MAG: hypothetical protein HYU66_26325, partial [Armatimonadetes bacterium]|nr:hypothetical protein [Armatimonadota bacterium]